VEGKILGESEQDNVSIIAVDQAFGSWWWLDQRRLWWLVWSMTSPGVSASIGLWSDDAADSRIAKPLWDFWKNAGNFQLPKYRNFTVAAEVRTLSLGENDRQVVDFGPCGQWGVLLPTKQAETIAAVRRSCPDERLVMQEIPV
jgi:hypothetical protein